MTLPDRLRGWLARSPREWLWAARRRLDPRGEYPLRFDGDLWIGVCPEDELSLRYALGGAFEPDIFELLDRFLRPGMCVFDVGANIGHYTLLAAKRVGPKGRVHAFEPSPHEFSKLAANVARNRFHNVRAHQRAVLDREGTVTLNLAGRGLGLYNSLSLPLRRGRVQSISVPCVSLDSYLRGEAGPRPDLVKIDVEGAELGVLRGARATLEAVDAPAIVCEFSDLTGHELGHSTRLLRQQLEQHGYDLFRYELETHALVPEPPRERYDYVNVVCLKPGREFSLRPVGS